MFPRHILQRFLGGVPELDSFVLRSSDQSVGVFVERGNRVDRLRVREYPRQNFYLVVLGVAHLHLPVLGPRVHQRMRGRT